MRWVLLFVVLFAQCSQIDDLREHMNKHCVEDVKP